MDLKVERVRANVTVTALAAQMGVSRQTVWGIERAATVNAERTDKYRGALRLLATGTVAA
jgi:DNA-binding XRE family transcriptional regulator